MEILSLLLGLAFLNVVYHSGKLIWAFRWGIHHTHYFLGFGPRLFTLKWRNTKFSFGFYIPIFGLSRIYEYAAGHKNRCLSAWEFSKQPIWKRLMVALGGTLSLAVAGVIIFITLAYNEQDSFVSRDEVNRWGIYPSPSAIEAGFKSGDKILLINGKEYERYDELLYPHAATHYTIIRDKQHQEITISDEVELKFLEDVVEYGQIPFLAINAPFSIMEIIAESIADSVGLHAGDQITAVNEIPISGFEDFKAALIADEDSKIDLSVKRSGHTKEILYASIPLSEDRKLGFIPQTMLQYTTKEPTLSEAIVKGAVRSYSILSSNLRGFAILFSGDTNSSTSRELKGPIGIREIYGGGFPWLHFWNITAIFAIWSAFISLLPLPNTSFWEVVPLGYEAATKKAFPYELYRKTRKLGYFIIFALMAWILIGDILALLY